MLGKSALPTRIEAAQLALIAGLIAISVYIAVESTTLSAGQMAIWPADGIALAMMLGPFRHRPLTVLVLSEIASTLPGALIGDNIIFIVSLKFADASLLFTLYKILKRYDYYNNSHQPRCIIALFSTALIGSLCASFIETYIVSLYFKIQFLPVYMSDAAANWVGYALLTPIFLIMTRERWRPFSGIGGLRDLGIIVIYTAVVGLVLSQARFPALFLLPLALMAVAYTTRLALVAFCLLATSLIAIYATISGHGPIVVYPGTPMDHLFMTQVVLGVITATCLPIAAMMAEHGRLKQSLLASKPRRPARPRATSWRPSAMKSAPPSTASSAWPRSWPRIRSTPSRPSGCGWCADPAKCCCRS